MNQNKNKLPKTWVMSTLGKICSKPQYGWTTKANPTNGNLKLLRTTDITSGSVDWETVPYCTKEPDEINKYLLQSGDIVISRAGSVGVSYLFTNVVKAVFASYLIRFKPHEQIDKRYVYYFLKSPDYWAAIGASKLGIAVPNVNATKLSQVAIPVAPPTEQKRIVAEIEKQFSRLDEATAALKRIKANLKRYKASVLKAAVEGKLTEEWRNRKGERPFAPEKEETGADLLKRILTDRRRKWEEEYIKKYVGAHGHAPKDDLWKKKYKEPVAPDTSNLPGLPDGWVWVNVGILSETIHYGYTASSTSQPIGPKMLRITDIQNNSVVWNNVPYCKIEKVEKAKYLLKDGDLVFARTGATVGKSFLVCGNIPESVFASYLIRIILSEYVSNKYIYYFFQSQAYWTQIHKGKLGIGQPNVNAQTLSQIALPLPSLLEQKIIVEETERRLSVSYEIEKEVDLNLKRTECLRQSILKKAFCGKLVKHDLNDKPVYE